MHLEGSSLRCRETQTVAVHKDSQWYQNWQNFKDNNAYLNSASFIDGRLVEFTLLV